MEDIYMNGEYGKSIHSGDSTNQTATRTSEKRFFGAIVLSLGLLSAFLLAAVIGLSIQYHNSVCVTAAELSTMKADFTNLQKDSDDKLSSLTEERDLLQANLTKFIAERDLLQASLLKTTEERNQLNNNLNSMTQERDELQKVSNQRKTCPAGWKVFRCFCYFLSTESGSWTKGRDDCRKRGGDLVVIDSTTEQTFLSGLTQQPAWIGLSDLETEGTWTWIDGTPLTLNYWAKTQPDNGGGDPQWGEEDCACGTDDNALWNDLACTSSLKWICEKIL